MPNKRIYLSLGQFYARLVQRTLDAFQSQLSQAILIRWRQVQWHLNDLFKKGAASRRTACSIPLSKCGRDNRVIKSEDVRGMSKAGG